MVKFESRMTMSLTTCLVFCAIFWVGFVHGSPVDRERRVSRDLDKIDGLKARLLALQRQIDALEESEQSKETADRGREKGSYTDVEGNDVIAENEVTELQSGSEAQMTSERQQNVQKLARKLDEGTDNDLKLLAATLTQLLRQTESEDAGAPRRTNTDGEYLSDRYNGYNDQGASDDKNQEDDTDSSDADDDLDSDEEESQLLNIYNTLRRMYDQQVAVETRTPQRQSRPDSGNSAHRSQSAVQVDEGSFGDFVDETHGSRPSSSSSPSRARQHAALRNTAMSAIESKLLRDVQDAQNAGISVDDLIRDIQNRGEKLKHEKLRDTESELNELSRSRS